MVTNKPTITRALREKRQLWVIRNKGIVNQIASASGRDRTFVSHILAGRRNSSDGLVERLLKEAGAPGF